MQLKIENCNGCQCDKPIVNRRHMLCNECNRKRLHPDTESFEIKRQKQRIALVNKYKPKPISIKQKQRNIEITDTYREMARVRERMCTGCGTTQRLSHSHIIPRSRRKDLEANIDNLTYHCLSIGDIRGCHDIWEHGTMEEKKSLYDFEQNMQYIKSVDEVYYRLLSLK